MSDLSERLHFLGIDENVKETLREAKPFIDGALPEVLNGFYTHLAGYPTVANLFPSPQIIAHARDMQLQHWQLITSANFDDRYVDSVKKIGRTHNRIGLEPRWYIGGYAFIGNRVIEAVSHTLRDRMMGGASEKRHRWLTALNTAVMLDMDFAISVYLEEGKREKREALDKLAAGFESSVSTVITSVASSAQQMQSSASNLKLVADDTKVKAAKVATASSEATQTTASVASASEQLLSSIKEISRQVQSSSTITQQADEMAKLAESAMRDLLAKTGQIDQVTNYINTVASQINLLSLNATIESARAGEAGKGFAVVAGEVKTLASQTTKAASEINEQVQSMQGAAELASQRIAEILSVVEQINGNINSIAAAVEEQSAATDEIARSVAATSRAADEVLTNIGTVEQGALRTTSSSSEVLNSADQLTKQADVLRAKVDEFLTTVKAA
jgi:hypothetical protein